MHRLLDPDRTSDLEYSDLQQRIEQLTPAEDSELDLTLVKEDVMKDIKRTYVVEDLEMEQRLYNVLVALAYVKPSIGYCQGLNFIAGALLKVLGSEASTFWTLLGMMRRFDLENMFVPGVPDLQLREYQFNYYIRYFHADLYAHFIREGVTGGIITSKWLLALYSSYLPQSTLEHVWDCFIAAGWKAIFKVGLAMLKDTKTIFMHSNLEGISSHQRQSHNKAHQNYKALLSSAVAIKIRTRELKKIEEQFYVDQASIKLEAAEQTHCFSDEEIRVLRWAKLQFHTFSTSVQKDVRAFQAKITKIERDIEHSQKHFLTASMDLINVKKEIDLLNERKTAYIETLLAMETKYHHKSKNFLFKLLSKQSGRRSHSSTPYNTSVDGLEINQEDLTRCRVKLGKIEDELKLLTDQHRERLSTYCEAKTRVEEMKTKKESYSGQLAGFLWDYQRKSPRQRHVELGDYD